MFLARMSRSKRPEILLGALRELKKKGVEFTAKFYGDPPATETDFYENLKENFPELKQWGIAGIPNTEAPRVFSANEIFVNLSPAGMYDKTLFEAAACGCLVLAVSPDFAELVGDERFYITGTNPAAIADKLEKILNLSDSEKSALSEKFRNLSASQNLKKLSDQLLVEISENQGEISNEVDKQKGAV